MADIKIKSVARKAVIAANPDCFVLPAPHQELFRATVHDAAQNKTDAILLKELLHIQCTAETPNVIKFRKSYYCARRIGWAYRERK